MYDFMNIIIVAFNWQFYFIRCMEILEIVFDLKRGRSKRFRPPKRGDTPKYPKYFALRAQEGNIHIFVMYSIPLKVLSK